MPAHGWILWPSLVLVTAVGAWFVGRGLEGNRRRILWLLSAAMILPAGYTVLALEQGGANWVLIDQLRASSLLVVVAAALGWAVVGALGALGRWETFVVPLQWVATGLALLVLISFVFIEGFEMSEGSPLFWLLWLLTYPLQATVLAAPVLASLMPSSLVWPTGGQPRAKLARQAGAAALVVVMVGWSVVGLASSDIEAREELPRGLREPRRALTVWVELDPGLDPTSGSTEDEEPRTRNLSVPFLVPKASSSNGTHEIAGELREEILIGYDRQKATLGWSSSGLLEVEARERIELSTSAHRFPEVIYPAAANLTLAGGFARAESPEDVEVRIHGTVGPDSGCHWRFDTTLPVRDPSNATAGQDPVPIDWRPSEACPPGVTSTPSYPRAREGQD